MLFHRSNHEAVLLADGRVLVIGGTTLESGFVDSNEVFDPNTGNWSLHSVMSENRTDHTASLLQSGTVLVAGGITGSRTLQSAEMLDPITQTFSVIANMNVPRNQHTDSIWMARCCSQPAARTQSISIPLRCSIH